MNQSGQSTFNQARIEWAIRLRYSPMPNLDMKYLASNLNAFRIGELRTVGKIWEVMVERDGELACNKEKRESDLAALEWNIESDGSPDGDKHAAALQYFYDHLTATHALDQDQIGGVPLLLEQLASAHSYYYSAHEILLRVDNAAAQEVTAEFRHTPTWFFETRRGYMANLKHIFDVYGQPAIEGEWLTAVGKGYMRDLCLMFALKAFCLRDWSTACTRYASGFLVVKSPGQVGDDNWTAAQQIMETLTNDGAVLMSTTVTAEFLQQANRSGMSFKELVDLVNSLYAKRYRGMDLATGSKTGGSSAGAGGGSQNAVGASVQGEESGIFLNYDALWATGYLNQRVDAPIIRYLFGQEPRAAICIMPPQPDTAAEDLATATGLIPLGFKISLKDAYKRFRWTPPEEGEPCLTAPVPASPPNPDGTPGKAPPIASPAASPALPESPTTSDTSDVPTQAARDPRAIGAGADPASMPQTAVRQMPDPQVDAGDFWSQAGAAFTGAGAAIKRAIFGPFTRDSVGNLPTAAYAIPNDAAPLHAPALSDDFTATAAERYATALHADMQHAAAQVKALLQIDDPDHFKAQSAQLQTKWDQITANTLLAPSSADALAEIAGTAYLQGAKKNPLPMTYDP